MKRVVILGSSGSVGESALRVIEALRPRFAVEGLAVRENYRRALEQAACFGARYVAVVDGDAARACAAAAPPGVRVLAGEEGLLEVASLPGADVVLCAVVGMAGLKPVLAAAREGATIALATKEILVGAGHIVTKTCAARGARLLPVDSEHSAIFQCLDGKPPESVGRILLTASGGPFGDQAGLDLERVSVEEVLAHPRWRMGRKVTVDSATMMNKGLEIMEARWLFGVPVARIEVVIHPESIVHSLVEFRDRSALAQLSVPDMRFAIQYALTYPERVSGNLPALDLAKAGALHFREPDPRRFPCLALARSAAEAGGTMPAVLNAANEVAVQRFLEGSLSFPGIWRTVEALMREHTPVRDPTIEDVMEADRWARRRTEERIRAS